MIRSVVKKNIFYRSVLEIYRFLPPQLKKKSIRVIFSLLLNAIVDIFGVAIIFPVFTILIDDNFLENRHMGWLYHALNFKRESDFFLFICVTVIIAIILKSIVYILTKRYQTKFSLEVYEYYSSRMFDLEYASGYSNILDKNSNESLNDVSNLPRSLSLYMIMPLFIIISEVLVLLIIMGALMYFYSNVIFLVMLPMIVVIYVFYTLVRKRLNYHEKKIHELVPENYKSIIDLVSGYVDIKLNNKFKFFRRRFSEVIVEEKKSRVSLGTLSDMPSRVVELGLVISIVIILMYCFYYIEDTESRLKMLGLFGLAAFRSTPSLNKILTAIVKVKGNSFILDIINKRNHDFKDDDTNESVTFNELISCSAITVAYGENLILDNFSCDIKKGDFTGIVGPSGTGKSTLVKLITGLQTASSGSIIIDDKVLSKDNLFSWQSQIGYVGQDVYLLDGTLKSNIAFGEDDVDEGKLKKVIESSGLNKFVEDLKEGLETRVGEDGALISGGQKQRIGIARALYKEPKVLILDESTNALDSAIEASIIDTLLSLKLDQDLTIIFVTHKMKNLERADNLISLEKHFKD